MPRSDPSPRKPPCPGCGRVPQARGEVNFCPGCGAALRGEDAAGAAGAGHPWVGRVVADRYRLISLLGGYLRAKQHHCQRHK